MGSLFSSNSSGSNSKRVGEKDKAILDMKVQRDKLYRYRTQVAAVVQKEQDTIVQLLREDKKKNALLVLKKKKYQENLLEKTDQQILNLEQLISEVENALVEQKVVESLKLGNSVLQQIHKEINIEDVQKLMDDTAEALAYQKEIDAVLSQQLGGISDDDILGELEALEQEMTAEAELSMPSAPTHALPTAQKQQPVSVDDIEVEEEAQASTSSSKKATSTKKAVAA